MSENETAKLDLIVPEIKLMDTNVQFASPHSKTPDNQEIPEFKI